MPRESDAYVLPLAGLPELGQLDVEVVRPATKATRELHKTRYVPSKDFVVEPVKNGMRGYHELAAEITRGQLSFPTVVFLDEKIEVIQSIPGYRDTKEFETIATYFGRNEHLKTPWETYQKNYQPLPKN